MWDPIWIPNSKFCITRAYTDLLVVGWNNANLVSGLPNIVLEETIFGGYRIHISLKPWFYQWSHKTAPFDQIFEDFYATAPGSNTPINASTVYAQWRICDPTFRHGFVFDMPGVDVHYWFFELPSAPTSYWNKDVTPIPAMPWKYDPTP